MRCGLIIALFIFSFAATGALAQTESYDPPDSATPVVIQERPATNLDAIDRAEGLVVKGLTSVGKMDDDRGGTLEIFAVTAEDKTHNQIARGIALVVTRKDGTAARSYVDEDEIDGLIDATKTLAALDGSATPMKESRGAYRTRGHVAVLNVDDNGGRVAIVRTLFISPVTSQATWAVSRFRSNRLSDLARYLQAAKEALPKTAKRP